MPYDMNYFVSYDGNMKNTFWGGKYCVTFPQKAKHKKTKEITANFLIITWTVRNRKDVESESGSPSVLWLLYLITRMSPEIWSLWMEEIWGCDEMSLPKTKDTIVSLCLTHCPLDDERIHNAINPLLISDASIVGLHHVPLTFHVWFECIKWKLTILCLLFILFRF